MERRVQSKASMNLRLALALAMAVAPSLSCGDADDIDVRDAQTSWTATNRAVAAAHTNFSAHVVFGDHGEVSAGCSGGGLVHLVGTMRAEHDFELDAQFDACVEDGVVINGDLTVTADVDVDLDDIDDGHGGASVLVVVDYQGKLELDGDVEGTCTIDAQVHAGAVAFEQFFAAGVTVEGSLCGHDAAAVIHG